MEQSSYSEANSSAASQGIPSRVSNPKVRLNVHRSPPFVTMLSQINAFHASRRICLRSIFISFPLCLDLPRGHFPSSLPNKTLYSFLIGTSALRLDED